MNHSCIILISFFVLFYFAEHCESATPTQEAISWSELPELPDSLGLGGAFAGVSNGALLVAGGLNFPHAVEGTRGSRAW